MRQMSFCGSAGCIAEVQGTLGKRRPASELEEKGSGIGATLELNFSVLSDKEEAEPVINCKTLIRLEAMKTLGMV